MIRETGTAGRMAFGVLVLIAVCVASMPARAQGRIAQACGSDYRKLCAGVKPGGGRIIACMKARHDEVSDTCRTALLDARDRRRASKPN